LADVVAKQDLIVGERHERRRRRSFGCECFGHDVSSAVVGESTIVAAVFVASSSRVQGRMQKEKGKRQREQSAKGIELSEQFRRLPFCVSSNFSFAFFLLPFTLARAALLREVLCPIQELDRAAPAAAPNAVNY